MKIAEENESKKKYQIKQLGHSVLTHLPLIRGVKMHYVSPQCGVKHILE